MKHVLLGEPGYPGRLAEVLKSKAPPELYVAGDLECEGSSLGVAGSRSASPELLQIASKIGKWAARQGWILVSGHAKGVDLAAMSACAESGGRVIGVTSDSLKRLAEKGPFASAIRAGSVALCSPFEPDSRFMAWKAMARNKIVYALADAAIVVAADLRTGGTWAGAEEALKFGWSRVGVWLGEGAPQANIALAELGAIGVFAIQEIPELLNRGPRQSALF